jgi:hypothetical protein
MAIINSMAIGKARKSAGNLTFATIKGRTIAREKPAYVRNPDTVKQRAQRDKMKKIVAVWRAFGYNVRHLFTVIGGYGSAYNEFVKQNLPLAETIQTDPVTGVPYACAGMVLGSGKFGSGALNIQANQANEVSINISDGQLRQEIQVGDIIGVVSASDNFNHFVVTTEQITEANISALSSGQYIDLPESYETGLLYAPFWYSSARNQSSTPILKKKV